MQDGVGAGQAHGTAEHLALQFEADARRLQRLFRQFCLLRQAAGGLVRQVAAAALVEQRLAEVLLQPADGPENRRHIDPEQLCGPRQATAANQGEDQGKIGMVQAILQRCIHLCIGADIECGNATIE